LIMEAVTREQDKLSIELDLTCLGDRGETLPFRISLHADAITLLIADAFCGDRVYEFLSICRHGDIKRYLWVRIIEVAERIRERYRYMEQLKRCAVTGGTPKDVFSISVLDLSVSGTADNRFPRASR